ncbi:MAG: hypothetical protein AAGL66_10765 [Pseudomonadota bacterium]
MKASYWFIPAAMTLAAIGVAEVTESLDRSGWTSVIPDLFYSMHGDAARAVGRKLRARPRSTGQLGDLARNLRVRIDNTTRHTQR